MRSIVKTLLALGVMLGGSSAGAQTTPPFFPIEQPEKWSKTEKIEVMEVFSYACGHCAAFQSLVDAWRKKLDTKKVEFVYVPAPYDDRDVQLARGYFAADKLGAVGKTHQAMFDSLHKNGIQIRSFADVAALYSRLGVAPTDFNRAALGAEMDALLRRTRGLMIKYKIDSTPTLVVNGKYRITSESAGGHENMLKVADALIKSLSTQTPSTSRQAPSNGK